MVTSAWRMVPVAPTSMAPTAVILWAFNLSIDLSSSLVALLTRRTYPY